jgi:hypothetical protein
MHLGVGGGLPASEQQGTQPPGKMRNATMSSNVLAAKWGSCSILPAIISAYLIRSTRHGGGKISWKQTTAHSSDNARSELKLLADSGSGSAAF